MLPQIHFLGRDIGMYSLCGVVGIIIAGWLFCHRLVKCGQRDSDGIFMILWTLLGSVIGSHLLYGLTHIQHWSMVTKASSVQEALLMLGKLFGGGVFYGGLIGGLVAAFGYIKMRKLDVTVFSDCAAICIPLFHSFARVGCFFAGCCYGIECAWGFASAANPYILDVIGVKRFPTQLLEAALNLALFTVLFALRNVKSVRGAMLCLYLLSYSVIRFGVEFLRGDAIRGIWLGMSTSQWISVCIFLTSSLTLFILIRKKDKGFRT